ncbi:MAG: PadR family transcriptional regulator [Candidatus Lokiarchaeota archaeon]|nr:PadR family transcriptional regulator [Candidatus Lokiarchaeota archaeon]
MSKNKSDETKKIDEIADAIEQSMKKGHISTLILLALEKGASHGYNLMQIIKNDTYGVWNPSASSLYPHLSSLTEKGLIKFISEMDGRRERKVYEITLKGKRTLKKLIERQQNMRKSLLSMIMSTIGITDSNIPNDFESLFGPELIEDTSLIDKTDDEKLGILSTRKLVLSKIIDKLQNVIDEIEQRMKNLKIN